jgi:hypothetical protein
MSQSGSPARIVRALAPALTLLLLVLTVPVAPGLSAAPVPASLEVAPVTPILDLNGDGMVDAVFTQKQRYNQVCFGNGTGAFTNCTNLIGAGTNVLSNQVNTTSSVLVDWDGDGDLDIALAMEGHANTVCFNDGGGNFNAGTGCVALFDYNSFPYNSQDVAAGDISGDGFPDLVFANGGNAGLPLSQQNVMCVGLGTGEAACYPLEFQGNATAAPSTGVALGDVDGDGDQDILTSNRGTLNEVCLNQGLTNGVPAFDCRAIPQAFGVSATKVSNAVAVGNLPNGFGVAPDGFLDVVFGNTGKNERCFGNGNWSGTNVGLACGGVNSIASYTESDANARTTGVILADILLPTPFSNAYVGEEIVFVNEDAPNVRCFGAFTCSFEFNEKEYRDVDFGGTIYNMYEPIAEASTGVAVRDINIDGNLDVVVANTGVIGGVSRMYPGSVFSPSTVAVSGRYPTSVTLSGGDVGPSEVDDDAPVLSGATNMTREATGPTGAVVMFSMTALDVVDGSRPVTCSPASGSVFAIGNTTVTCTAEDEAGNVGTATFVVSVVDTTDPAVVVPTDMVVHAPAGQTSAAVTFPVSAYDLVDGVVEHFCFVGGSGVESGDQFSGGTRTVRCGAYDSRLNYGESSFTLTVITDVDADGILDNVDLDDDGDGIADTVDTLPLASSNTYLFNATNTGTVTRNGWTVTIAPTSGGSSYDLRVTLSGAGTAPAIVSAYCGYVRKELRLDTAGETADWRCVTGGHASTNSLAVNFVSGTAEFWKVSASVWTRITPTAGNTAVTAGSPVTADAANTAPVLVNLFNESLEEVGSFSLEAGESVDVEGVEVNGVTSVQLTLLNGGTDGIVAVTMFGQPVTLQGSGPVTFDLNPDLTAPAITVPANITAQATDASGAMVTYTASAQDLEDPAPSFGCVPASGSLFSIGTTTVTCTATDAAGNSASASFTVTVVDTPPPTLEQQIRAIAGSTADQLVHAAQNILTAPNAQARAGRLTAFRNQVNAQLKSRKITAAQAAQLNALINGLN